MRSRARPLSEARGIYLVMFSLLLVVILMLVAVLVSLGYLTSSQLRFQRVSNFVALAGLEDFLQNTQQAYDQRALSARNRAEQILQENKLPGFESFGGIAQDGVSGAPGTIIFGEYLATRPAVPSARQCGDAETDYPCFIAHPPPDPALNLPTNSTYVKLRNQSGNTLNSAFCSLLGTCDIGVQANATASLVQRCTSLIIDVSPSTYSATHPVGCGSGCFASKASQYSVWSTMAGCEGPTAGPEDDILHCAAKAQVTPPKPNERAPVSYAFYRADNYPYQQVLPGSAASMIGGTVQYSPLPGPGVDPQCQNSSWINGANRLLFCNMYAQRDTASSISPFHYQSDYRVRQIVDPDNVTRYLLVDSFVTPDGTYRGPEPLASFFQAFNSGLREMKKNLTAADRAALMGITGRIKGQFPSNGLSNNFGMLVQLTNFENRGTFTFDAATGYHVESPEIRPNFLDYGLFSVGETYVDSSTNLVLALNRAISLLNDPNNGCPSTAQRTIVIATDGVSSCRVDGGNLSSVDPNDYLCDFDDYSVFVDAERQLVDEDDPNSVLSRLINNQINVIVLQAGAYLGLNYRNMAYNGRLLDLPEIYSRSMGGGYNTPGSNLFDTISRCKGPTGWQACPDQTAYSNIGNEGYRFGLPIRALADLGIMSGGIYCPLMPSCSAAEHGWACDDSPTCCDDGESGGCCYKKVNVNDPNSICKLKDSYRPVGSYQDCSIYNLSSGQQAAKCVLDGLGGSPYVLVEPVKMCRDGGEPNCCTEPFDCL
ncbi:MAG: hypothetical protein K1X83_03725 [Oligoflexia bacterium]|nr:hypothetical protein [Oligoflexia bacterium]